MRTTYGWKLLPYLLPYLRDVRDHLLLVNEEVSAQRDLLATILEANMAVITVEPPWYWSRIMPPTTASTAVSEAAGEVEGEAESTAAGSEEGQRVCNPTPTAV